MKRAGFYDGLWAGEWRDLPSHGPLSYTRQRLMLRELGPSIRPGMRLLDVGCGDGTFLFRLQARFPELEVAGIDFSAAAKDGAPESLRSALKVGDVEKLTDYFEPESFDAVVSCEVLEHVEDPVAVLDGIAKLLKPGGVGVLTVPLGMQHWSELDDAGQHLRRFEPGELEAQASDAGLVLEKSYGWGGPVARPYYALSQKIGSKSLASSAKTSFGKAAGYALQLAFRIDDYFPSDKGFQLICRVKKASSAEEEGAGT